MTTATATARSSLRLETRGMALFLISATAAAKTELTNDNFDELVFGTGKSAFINYLHGCTFSYEDDDKMVVRPDSPVAELMRIGHSKRAEGAVRHLPAGRQYLPHRACHESVRGERRAAPRRHWRIGLVGRI